MIRVGIVAPGRRLDEKIGAQILSYVASSGLPIELVIHPQCYLSHGHFAGDDNARSEAFLDFANDPKLDAIWFARGGYGAARVLADLRGRLNAQALNKVYLGYSDIGFLLAGLTRVGCRFCAHGPVVADIARDGGAATIDRALGFLARMDAAGIEPQVQAGTPNLALNLTILRSLLGTPYLGDDIKSYEGATLWVEDVAEYAYATDRAMFQISHARWFEALAGVRIGRFSLVPENDVPFPLTSEEAVAHWCTKANVAVLGPADIGHDIDNKIVPFGDLIQWRSAGFIV